MVVQHTRKISKASLVKSLIADEELIKFAKQFSDSFKELEADYDYTSEPLRKYTIKYCDAVLNKRGLEIRETDQSRVAHSTGNIELGKKWLIKNKASKDFVFFLIIWCQIQHITRDYVLSDKYALKCCLKHGYSAKNLAKGLIRMLSGRGNIELNEKRLPLILKQLNNEK